LYENPIVSRNREMLIFQFAQFVFLLGALPETAGLLALGIGLVASTAALRRLLTKYDSDENVDDRKK
jgi:hypothetical protein